MKRKIIFSDEWTEISVTKSRGRIVRRYNDSDDQKCFVSVCEAGCVAEICRDLDANPHAMPSHSYTREYVKHHSRK